MDKQIRTCIISRKKDEKNNLIQISIHPSWEIQVLEKWESWIKWRSIYLSKSKKVIDEFENRWVKFFSNFIKRKVYKEKYECMLVDLKSIGNFSV